MLKGTLPTLAMGYLLGRLGSFSMPARDAWWWLAAMVAPVMGLVFSPWLKFMGGKGVATALGVMFGVFPVLTVVGAAGLTTWVIVLSIWRYISVASMVAGTLLPVFAVTEFLLAELAGLIDPRVGTFDAAWPFVAFTCVLAVLVVLTHLSNIKRLRNGTELRAGKKPASSTSSESPPSPPSHPPIPPPAS